MGVAFSPDGKRLASASMDQTIKVWDVASGAESITLKGHSSGAMSVAFSPDGKRLATGGGHNMIGASGVSDSNNRVRVWDATNGTELLALQGHTKRVQYVAFSPDGKRLASASDDKTVKVWDVTPLAE